jgi:outer membrane protein insertion porin family
MKNYPLSLLLLLSLFSFQTWSADNFIVEEIKVDGLQRNSEGLVFDTLPIVVGDEFTAQKGSLSIKELYKTQFFKDIQLFRKGNTLIVKVVEQSSIGEINIEGNKLIASDDLTDGLKQVGLSEGRVFNRSLFDKLEQDLQRQYHNQGYYGVRIQSHVTDIERNRVKVEIIILEGEIAKIRQINLIGNTAFDDETLLDLFSLSSSSFFSFFTDSDKYSREQLSADLEILRSYYLDRGYINFKIDSTQVSLSPSRKDVYITMNMTEGAQYKVSEINITGDEILTEEETLKLISIDKQEIFSRSKVNRSSARITQKLGNLGYAFADVNPRPIVDDETNQVALSFSIQAGNKVYIRRINFSGNTKTDDRVLRREMRQIENSLYSGKKLKRSVARLERLGFFERVDISTPKVESDQVDINIDVDETFTGNFIASLGWSQVENILLTAKIQEQNFFGGGDKVSLEANKSAANQVFSLNYTNPFFNLDGDSVSHGIFFREQDAAELSIASYSTNSRGISSHFGIALNEDRRIRLGLILKETTLNCGLILITDDQPGCEFHDSPKNSIELSSQWIYDTRNRFFFADKGEYRNLSLEVSTPGADLRYYKLSYRHQWYKPIIGDMTFFLRGEVAYGASYEASSGLPIYEHFFAGGQSSIRGYRGNSVGSKDTKVSESPTGQPVGGTFKTVGSAEIFIPVGEDNSRNFRLSLFYDIGSVYGRIPESFDDYKQELRSTVGISAVWITPMVPIVLSWGFPIDLKEEDISNEQTLQFSLGVFY